MDTSETKETPKTLHDHLHEMLDHFHTKSALADAADIKRPSVQGWFSGKTKPSMRALIKIEKKTNRKFKAKNIRPELFD